MKFIDVQSIIRKNFPNMVYTGDELVDMTVPKLPSGVFSFDLVTGGGIPLHRATMFHGAKSSGKTTHMLRMIRSFLNTYKDKSVVFVDFEQTFDWDWAKHFIPDRRRFYLIQPDYGEQGVDIIQAACKAEDLGLLLVDTLVMMICTVEVEADASDDFVGAQARLIRKLLQKLTVLMSKAKRHGRPFTIILSNQVRTAIGGRAFQSQTKKPGGKFQDHYVSMDVKFYAGEYTKVSGVPIKVKQQFSLTKNKTGLPAQSGEFNYYLIDFDNYKVGDADETKTIVQYARRMAVAHKSGKGWNVGQRSFKNLTDMFEFYADNRKELEKLKKIVLNACMDNIMASSGKDEEE